MLVRIRYNIQLVFISKEIYLIIVIKTLITILISRISDNGEMGKGNPLPPNKRILGKVITKHLLGLHTMTILRINIV